MLRGAALLRRRPNQSLRQRGRRQLDPSRRGEGAAEGTGGRRYLCRQRRLGRLVEGLSTHQCAGGPWRLEDRRNCSQVSPCAGRLPSGRGPNADRPSMSWATSTARRIAAATWIMSSTTVASRAYAVVPAKRSRWSRGGAYRPRSAPAAGSARHRADAGRRDRAARSPDPQPASCRRSFRRGYPARAAPSTRHHWRPRPDRQPVPGCVGRDVLAGACVPTSGPAGAVPVRVRSRSSAGLRWRRGRLWHPRRQHRPLRTGPGSGDRCEGRRFAPLARRIYVPGILSSQPSQVCPPAHGTVPERRANVQKGARPRGTDRRYSVPFRGSAGRRNDAGTRWLGCCPPEMSTGETHPRAKRPMNRAKTPLRRRAAPNAEWARGIARLNEFERLYGKVEHVALLNRIGGAFFAAVQQILWDDLLLCVTRLTDPPETGRAANLTIRRLPEFCELVKLPMKELEEQLNAAVEAAEFARSHRNKRISHKDLDYVISRNELGAALLRRRLQGSLRAA